MRSLRVRVTLVVALLAVVALAAMTLLSRHVVERDLERLRVERAPFDPRPLREAAAWLEAAPRSAADTDSVLARAAGGGTTALVIVGPQGEVIASSSPMFRRARVRADSLGQTIVTAAPRGSRERGGIELILRNPSRAALRGGAILLAVPEPPASDALPAGSHEQVRQVLTHGLLIGALAAFGLAAALVWMFAGRIVRPIEEITAAARRMAAGDLDARVAVRGDDEVATLARGFNAMADSLAGAEAMRQRLTRDVAHELRTPLTALRAQIEALQDGLVAPSPAVLASLHDEVRLLTRLVEDVESVARSDAGTMTIEPRAVSAREALQTASSAFAAEAAARGVALRVEDGDCAVRADPLRLAQILRNLVANALAATPRGGAVRLGARDDGDSVALRVADTGAGIAAEHLPHIFDRFYRADPARSRATGGSGLGLAIVQQLAAAHGGSVHAESAVGRGTAITVRLPRA